MDTPSLAPSQAHAAAPSIDASADAAFPFVSRPAKHHAVPVARRRASARGARTHAERAAAEHAADDESMRRHFAGELHDGLGAELTAARFALANVETWLPADSPDACRRALALAQQALDAATATNRRLIDTLRTPVLDLGLARTLAAWIGAHGERTGLRTRFVCAADARIARLSADGALTVFRVAQEALANVAKHARASAVDVRIDADATHLSLTVADDGTGIPLACRPGYGIGSMRARCEAAGGTLTLGVPNTGGTALRARFAWAALVAAPAESPWQEAR
ncbi:sensor histidine kinase [Burkholderia singularis]|uniref:histidine kinase n=1 Tax=Burkholderia singularis TaxID=1503053 RepID=A0A238H8S9_9BURK|nr:histidine kinase [Burkholderia singularis]SMG01485.1 Signal transduction histidine kinase [Burkholderia singularis]